MQVLDGDADGCVTAAELTDAVTRWADVEREARSEQRPRRQPACAASSPTHDAAADDAEDEVELELPVFRAARKRPARSSSMSSGSTSSGSDS
tara:strand:+ start:234 stop:512 length:279 start_codon:yes stop_codon:yes gene_type:complete